MTSKRPGSCSPGWESHPSTAHCRRTRTRTRARADVPRVRRPTLHSRPGQHPPRIRHLLAADRHRMGRSTDRRTDTTGNPAALRAPKLHVTVRKNSRGGRSSRTPHISAPLPLPPRDSRQSHPETTNPAIRVAKPRRHPSTRRAIRENRLAEIVAIAAVTGNDPELDTLILRLHIETACRRGGALALRPCDLDIDQSLVKLREKGETTRWQPISPTLMCHLLNHTGARGSEPATKLLRYRNSQPITSRRYDHLWARIGQQLPWPPHSRSARTGSGIPLSRGSKGASATP